MRINFSSQKLKSDSGFSITELLLVLLIIGIGASISLFYLTAHRRLLKPSEQARQVLDVMQEARQRALTQRETIRVEVDLEDNVMRLVDENTTSSKTDAKIRQIALLPSSEVKIENPPTGISTKPNAVMELPDAKFKNVTTSTSLNHKVFILRFKNDGTVIDTDGKPDGASLYLWSLKQGQTQPEIALAITVEPSGLLRYWQYDWNSTASNKWKNN